MMCVLILGLILVIELMVLHPDGAFVWLFLDYFSSLPKTIETITEHLPILGLALRGDRFRTSLAAEAFKEFWTVYSDIVKPREGWPAGLVRCLACAGQPTDRTEGDSMNMLLLSSSPTLVQHLLMMLRMNQVSK